MVQTIFKRYELKYILTLHQFDDLKLCMQNFMSADDYGRHKISNVYFDTFDYKIIRHSLEKPNYKEKLRLRLYGEPDDLKPTFIELKKKFDGVVYKRRITMPQNQSTAYLWDNQIPEKSSQILNEIEYFRQSYSDLSPRVYLSYEREAYFGNEDNNFRMTFDFNIKTRNKDVTLFDDDLDQPVLIDDYVLMEVKTAQGLPFWFINFLDEQKIFKTSFSKYGTAYNKYYFTEFLDSLRSFSHG